METQPSRTFWEGRPVFVTGASGFLGGWLVSTLLGRGARVVSYVRQVSPDSRLGREGLLSRVTAVTGSLDDYGLIERTLKERAIQTIFHLAAQPFVGVAKANPAATFQVNIAGTWNILEAARQAKVREVLVASSEKAYGENPNLPYTEDMPFGGGGPYEYSKICADMLACCYRSTYGLRVCEVRCTNMFGGGDLNFSRLIPGVIKSGLEGNPFVIRSDGQSVRDILYVKDAVRAYLRLAEALQAGAPAGPYNFCQEERRTTIEYVHEVLALLGRLDLHPEILNQPSGEPRESYMSAAKARRVLGWEPTYTVKDALRETIAWYKAHLGREPQAARGAAA
jgi:CDP-glucose 4,6-dehydratase